MKNYVMIFLVVSALFAYEDSTKATTKYVSGIRGTFHMQEKLLREMANCLVGVEGGADISMGLSGPKLPMGFDVDIHWGKPKNERLRFPGGYSYMSCFNNGKDSDTYLKLMRHIIYAGVLYYLNDFVEGNFVPYINGNLAFFTYGYRLEWKTNDKELQDVKQLVGAGLANGVSYYLSAGLAYSFGDGMGLCAEVIYNGYVNTFSFSTGLIGTM